MKINVLVFDVFIWTNQIRVNGESARASFDWLQEGGPASPSRLQISVSERIVPKTASADKRETELYKSDYFRVCRVTFYPTYTTSHLDMWQSVFLQIQIGSTRSIRFCSSLNCCFRLQITVHRLAVLLIIFWRKKTLQKFKARNSGSHTNADQGRSHGCARVCRCHPQWQLAHLKTDAE